jgi:hydrogen peroxide-dependent heme synthase
LKEEAVTSARKARDINDEIVYMMVSVFKVTQPLPQGDLAAKEVLAAFDAVTLRGLYDVSGLRADADIMVWAHSRSSDDLQEAYHALTRTDVGRHLAPVWSQLALHRPAEFNKSHVPAFLMGEDPRRYLCVYPFVRSYEWYLLPDDERRDLLVEHGRMARGFPDVRANTVASFALGDYEWILAFEADELHRIVDLMRLLRGSGARRHVREEVPFYTGRLRDVADLLADFRP